MLVYIRESDKDKIICNVDEKDIAEHLRVRWLLTLLVVIWIFNALYIPFKMLLYALNITFQIRLKKEQEEKEQKRKEKAEAHLYTVIKVQHSLWFFLSLSPHTRAHKSLWFLIPFFFLLSGCTKWGPSRTDWKGYILWSCGSWKSS